MNKKRILIYFGVCIALFTLLAVCLFYLSKLNAAEKYAAKIDRAYSVILKLGQLEKELLSAETGQRGFIISKDSSFLSQYQKSLSEMPELFLKIDYLTFDNYQQQKRIDTLKNLINERLALLRKSLENNIGEGRGTGFAKSKTYMDQVRNLIMRIDMNEQALLKKRNSYRIKSAGESKTSGFRSIITAFVICCIACAGLLLFFNRNQKYLAELETRNFQLTALNDELEILTGVSTHNLQEPMRKMQILIDVLDHAEQNHLNAGDVITRIKKVYSDQSYINNAIVNYYAVLTGRPVLNNLEIAACIEDLVNEKQWNRYARVNIPPKLVISADETWMSMMFEQLLQNAVDFKKPGKDPEIEINVLKDFPEGNDVELQLKKKAYTILEIKDKGQGIPDVYHTKVFELFQQVSDTIISGKGLGLSISRRIMVAHQGRIMINKAYKDGVSVLLFFPKMK